MREGPEEQGRAFKNRNATESWQGPIRIQTRSECGDGERQRESG